jgi:hypothetical protein
MGSGSLALAFRPIQATPAASSNPVSDKAATRSLSFLSLPEELKARSFSFVPARVVASICRAVCPELRDIVDRYENQIAHLKIVRKHADLQHHINTLTHMEPHDLASFISCFRVWIAQRGPANYLHKSWYNPFTNWLNTLNLDSKREEGWEANLAHWKKLAFHLMDLQRDVSSLDWRVHARILRQALQVARPWERDYAQYTEICELISKQLDAPWLFDFKNPEVKRRETLTYPVFRLSQAAYRKKKGRKGIQVLDPFFPPESVAQLALPSLPDDRFCYYVEEEWCIKLLNTGGVFSPLAKAALLETVKIF